MSADHIVLLGSWIRILGVVTDLDRIILSHDSFPHKVVGHSRRFQSIICADLTPDRILK